MEGFMFFPSYVKAMDKMTDSQKVKFIYGLIDIANGYENVPEDEDDAFVSMALALAEPNVSESIKVRKNGKKGGRPPVKNDGKNPCLNPGKNPPLNPPFEEGENKENPPLNPPLNPCLNQEERRGEKRIEEKRIEEETLRACARAGESLSRNDSSGFGIEKEFEALWEAYPKKAGKQIALLSYAKARTEDGVEFNAVRDGIEAYKRHIESSGLNFKFVLSGSRFFTERRWEDEYSSSECCEEDDTYF